jgi:hypothetical protein
MKQLIILVSYIDVGYLSEQKTQEKLGNSRDILQNTFSENLQDETNTIVKCITIPVKDQRTYIECIYPAEPYLPDELKEKFDQIELTLKDNETNRSEN